MNFVVENYSILGANVLYRIVFVQAFNSNKLRYIDSCDI